MRGNAVTKSWENEVASTGASHDGRFDEEP